MAEPSPAAEAAAILIVDDDAAVCWALEQVLRSQGYRVTIAADAAAARRLVRRARPDLVITDVRMPGESGLDLLAGLKQEYPGLPVVVTTAHGTMETAIEAVARGAFDYLPKPLDLDRTLDLVKRALGEDTLALAAQPLPDGAAVEATIIGSTPAMQEVYRRIAAAAATDLGVLVTGDSGTGKELVARALHRFSKRREGAFIAVNCGAMPEALVESELFGHEPGAFTDAKARKIGRVEAADGGTLFLDEVAELPPAAQVKLLRFLEDQRFTRVGGTAELRVDVRVIAATNRDLVRLTASGAFRDDLGYRLRVISIALPRLADRLDDLPALVRHILARAASRLGRSLALTDDALALLGRHSWPGNVRELKHVLEEAAVLATGGIIAPDHISLPTATGQAPPSSSLNAALAALSSRLFAQHAGEVHQRFLAAVEEPLLRAVLARTEGNQLRAAELLGINRITLKKRMDELGIGKG
ncbi:MAG: sigma-54-dependent Fis family transcriptional regulator [Planctomycetes bacterium]|nr:sigma-54-dependent Fis family transcriptional regulator [Planctomycetota bacterium]